jgi:transcriptional regulator with XRE-family HTH domain
MQFLTHVNDIALCQPHGIGDSFFPGPCMSPEQSRAARGWLGLSQDQLAAMASVSLSTVRDFEKGRRSPIANNLAAIRRVFEENGIHFLFHPDGRASGIVEVDHRRY